MASAIWSPTLIGPLSAVPCSTEISFGADGCRPSTMVVGSNGAGDIEFPIAGAPPEGLIGLGVEPFRSDRDGRDRADGADRLLDAVDGLHLVDDRLIERNGRLALIVVERRLLA